MKTFVLFKNDVYVGSIYKISTTFYARNTCITSIKSDLELTPKR